VAHTPLLDGVVNWDTHYSMWLHDDGTIGSLGQQMMADEGVSEDIARFGFAGRASFSMNKMDSLLAVSTKARVFVESNLARIARTDRLPVSCEGMDAPVGRHVAVEAGGRTYILTRLANGNVQQVVPLSFNFRKSDDYKSRFGRTVIRGDLWKGFHQDMGNVAKEGGLAFSNGKKPIRLIKQLIRWANNSPDALILDFFGGSGTTAHAVMAMNAEDGGRRQSIVVTNNEVGPQNAQRMRRTGLRPGDPDWEAQGVFESVTRPRITTVVTGQKPDGSSYPDALAANVEFFDVHYLDPGMVRRGREYAAIAPLLWLAAGATDECIGESTQSGWALTGRYGVLFDTDATAGFSDAVTKAVLDGADIRVCFVVTDSDTAYERALSRLPQGLSVKRLYEDYLTNFEINTHGGV